MEYILWGLVIVLLCIMTVLLITSTVFLVRVMRDISKDMPKVEFPNPIQEYTERQTKKQAEKEAKKQAKLEQDKIETILKNIENYDGTGFGQIDVPRG